MIILDTNVISELMKEQPDHHVQQGKIFNIRRTIYKLVSLIGGSPMSID